MRVGMPIILRCDSFRTRVRIAPTSCLLAWKADTTSASVADWSQAKIGYTFFKPPHPSGMLRIGLRPRLVTLRSMLSRLRLLLRIGLRPRLVTLYDRLQTLEAMLRIGLRPRLVTLHAIAIAYRPALRIGLRPRLVTLGHNKPVVAICCGLVSGQDWLHFILDSKEIIGSCGLVSGQDWLH